MEYLEKYNAMKFAIAECHNIDEIKLIRDKAEAYRYVLIQAKEAPEWIRQAEEIKLRAERKAGEILKEEVREPGERDDHIQMSEAPTFEKPKLPEMGITRDQSSNWQRIADIPEEKFEEYIQTEKEITTSGAVKLAKDLKRDNRINEEKEYRATKTLDIDIRKGDFKLVLDNVNDIDAIITDPPYPKEYLQCFSDLSLFASKHLKKDGFIAIYSGQYHLPEVIKRLSEYLTYVWTFCLYHVGKKQLVNGVNIMCGWKPVLIYSNGNKKMRFSAYDVLISEAREKFSHEWQQSESGVESLIDILSKPGDLIVDPFSGSGSFGVVANKLGRKFIGAEIE